MPIEDNQAIKEATRREDARVVKKAISELRKVKRKEQRKELARILSEWYVEHPVKFTLIAGAAAWIVVRLGEVVFIVIGQQ
jgi:hypothetical protein